MACSKQDGDAGQQQGRSTPYPNVTSLNLNDFMNNKLAQCVNHVKDEIKTVETGLAEASNHLASADRSLPKKAKSSSFLELGNSRKCLYRHAEGYGSFHFSKSRRHRRTRFSPLREVPRAATCSYEMWKAASASRSVSLLNCELALDLGILQISATRPKSAPPSSSTNFQGFGWNGRR